MRDGWKALPLSDVVEHTIGGVWGAESGTDEVEVTVVRSTEFTKRGFLNFETGVSRSIKHSQIKSRELKEGDILLEKSGGGPDQPVGRVVYVTAEIPNKFVCSNFVQLVRPDPKLVDPLLLFHIMWQWHAINRTLEFQAQTTGIRNLRTPDYLEQEITLPPLPEQKRIVDLISSVDSYIEALEKQLETGKKSRNAVLHELLTTGGDDWTETTLGEIADWGSGGTPKADNPDFYGGGINWCVIGDLTESEVWETEKTITKLGLDKSSAKIIEPGCVLLAMYGASIGRTGISAIPMATNQAIAFAKCDINLVLPKYLLAYLQTQKEEFVEVGQGAAQPNISQTIIKSWKVVLPPISYQTESISIMNFFDVTIVGLRANIQSTKELRSSLLSDLLSGAHEIPASYDKVMDVA
jgi:type I restriction enzyme S subunit